MCSCAACDSSCAAPSTATYSEEMPTQHNRHSQRHTHTLSLPHTHEHTHTGPVKRSLTTIEASSGGSAPKVFPSVSSHLIRFTHSLNSSFIHLPFANSFLPHSTLHFTRRHVYRISRSHFTLFPLIASISAPSLTNLSLSPITFLLYRTCIIIYIPNINDNKKRNP